MKNEIRVLLSLAILAAILDYIIAKNNIEFQLHDTYIVLDFTFTFIVLFIFLSFFVFLTWQILTQFKSKKRNYVLIFISGIVLIISGVAYFSL